MRGRWASAAIGAGVARRRASGQMDQQAQANEAQQQQSQQQIAAQQKQMGSVRNGSSPLYKLASGYAVPNPGRPKTLPRSEGYACHGSRIARQGFETLSNGKLYT